MKKFNLFGMFLIVFMVAGCQTVSPVSTPQESRTEVEQSIESVAEALSGRSLSKEDMERFKDQIRTNPDAQEAVQVITDSMTGRNVSVKYCPEDGKRYDAHLEYCPGSNTRLRWVEE